MDKDMKAPLKHETEISPAEESTAIDAISARRRKLIGASAAAVPAIMTLRSGAAAAAARISMECRHKDEQKAMDFPPDNVLGDQTGEPPHDEWLRMFAKVGDKVTVKDNGTDQIFYVLETNSSVDPRHYFDSAGNRVEHIPTNNGLITRINNAISPATNVYYVDNNGWECTNANEGCVGPDCTVALVVSTGSALINALASDSYKEVQLLVSVSWSMDGQTAVLTYYPQSAIINDITGAPITESCWCSIDPNTNLLG